jgi:hypothetical protein
MAPLIRNFTTRWLWVVSLLSQLLLLLGKELSNNRQTPGWVGPRTGLDTLEERKIQTPDHPPCRPVTIMSMVSHTLHCILSHFKTLHVLITQRLNSLVTIYVYSLFRNIETERIYMPLCLTDRETDGCKLPVITLGPSYRAQTPTENIS